MFKRVTLLTLAGMLILCLAGCSGGGETAQQPAAAPAPPQKPVEEPVPVYELTKDDITSHEGWTSRNISILGLKLGDKTRDMEKNLGSLENTRTLPDEYLTIYQNNGLFVYTYKLTGRARQIEVNQVFAKKVADPKLKRLLTSGDIKYMRELFGMEEGEPIQNADDMSTEYSYDSRGFRFVKYKAGVNAIRFIEMKKTAT